MSSGYVVARPETQNIVDFLGEVILHPFLFFEGDGIAREIKDRSRILRCHLEKNAEGNIQGTRTESIAINSNCWTFIRLPSYQTFVQTDLVAKRAMQGYRILYWPASGL